MKNKFPRVWFGGVDPLCVDELLRQHIADRAEIEEARKQLHNASAIAAAFEADVRNAQERAEKAETKASAAVERLNAVTVRCAIPPSVPGWLEFGTEGIPLQLVKHYEAAMAVPIGQDGLEIEGALPELIVQEVSTSLGDHYDIGRAQIRLVDFLAALAEVRPQFPGTPRKKVEWGDGS